MGGLLIVVIFIIIVVALVKNPFTQSCPVPEEERRWIERTITRFITLYGKERFFKTRMLLPNYAGFPRPYTNTEGYATAVFEEICAIMDIDPDDVDLEFGNADPDGDMDVFDDDMSHRQVPGFYTPEFDQVVTLNLRLLQGFDRLVAVTAHELSHVSLDRIVLEEIDHSEHDYEATIDVVSVFHGFGLFMARLNSGSSLSGIQTRLGYLALPGICYALAFIAWKRREDISGWKEHLPHDVNTLVTRSFKAIQDAHQSERTPSIKKGTTPTSEPLDVHLHVDQMLNQAMAQSLSAVSLPNDTPQIDQMLRKAQEQQQHTSPQKLSDEDSKKKNNES